MREWIQDSNLAKWKNINDQYSQKLFKACKISWCPTATEVCSARVQTDTVVLELLEKYASTLSTTAVSGVTHVGNAHVLKKTTVLATILKETNNAPEQHQKIISHWKCSWTWSFNCSQKAIFYIWHFFNFSLDDPGKAICSICNRRVNSHKPGAHFGTSALSFHLQVLQPMYSSDRSQNKIKK